jgi:hypothetical protein
MDRDWTDKRMDDFAGRVDRFEANVDRRFDKVDQRFEQFEGSVDRRFDKLDARLNRWGQVLGGGTVTIIAAVIVKLFVG